MKRVRVNVWHYNQPSAIFTIPTRKTGDTMPEVTPEMLSNAAISLLAQRDYSRQELERKLKVMSDDEDLISRVLESLKEQQLQSDNRFVENFIRSRINKGHGPMRISMDLKQKGIDSETISLALEEAEVDWFERAETIRQKKFGSEPVTEPKEKARQIRFLQYRGYPANIVMELF